MIRNRRLDLLNAERRVLASIAADQPSVSNLPSSAYFFQPDFDALLRRTVGSMPGVEVRLGCEFLKVAESSEGVRLTVSGGGYDEALINVGWVIGCDGAWSPVREEVGIKLQSLNFDERWLVFDLVLDGCHPSLPKDHVVEVCDPARPYLSTPISKNRQRFEFMLLPDDDAEVMKQPEEASRLLASWIPEGGYAIERAAVYTFHGLVAEQWRQGRVLLAGDAAHQTPPFLGQGMCAGIRDAANLAWKLSLVVKGKAPAALLDTYQTERKPHAEAVIEAAIRIGKVICELDAEKAAARNASLLGNDPTTRNRLAFALPRLQRGPLVQANGGSLFIQPAVNGIRLDTLVGPQFFIFARSRADLGNAGIWWAEHMDAVVATPDEIAEQSLQEWLDRHKANVVVVRPDRYVLGAGSTLEEITRGVEDWIATPLERRVAIADDV
jgi:3-(3-hydroxy-phenyl)propionate hydroxylase